MNVSVASNRYSIKGTISAAIAAALTAFAIVAQTSAQTADTVITPAAPLSGLERAATASAGTA